MAELVTAELPDEAGRFGLVPSDRVSRSRLCTAMMVAEDLRAGRPRLRSNATLGALRYTIRTITMLRAIERWAAQFPDGAIPFLERHRFVARRWHLLNLWVRVPEGRELFDDLPALAWLMASSWNVKANPVRRPFRSFRSLVRQPRRKILAWLDLPAGRGTVRLLRRIDPAILTSLTAFHLIRVLRDPTARHLLANFTGPFTPTVLAILASGDPVSLPVLTAIANGRIVGSTGTQFDAIDVYQDTLRMLGDARRDRLNEVKSPQGLLALHDRLLDAMNRDLRQNARARRTLASSWQGAIPPPFAPADGLRPLETFDELAREGREMGHCVASYAPQITRGSYYVYAVEVAGERATLGLERQSATAWEIDQLNGPRNRRVSRPLRSLVLRWFASKLSSVLAPASAERRNPAPAPAERQNPAPAPAKRQNPPPPTIRMEQCLFPF